jgi:hypothetical protein
MMVVKISLFVPIQSFTSRDKSSEHLARFYTFNSIKKAKKIIIKLLYYRLKILTS